MACRIEPRPRQWKHRVLTTRPPGNSLIIISWSQWAGQPVYLVGKDVEPENLGSNPGPVMHKLLAEGHVTSAYPPHPQPLQSGSLLWVTHFALRTQDTAVWTGVEPRYGQATSRLVRGLWCGPVWEIQLRGIMGTNWTIQILSSAESECETWRKD